MEKESILLIEDDKFFRDLVSKKLVESGFEVLMAHDSKEAFEVLENSNPVIIILDLILPGLDGFEILSMIKKDKKTSDVPVIILSNLGQEEEVAKAKALGAADFMIKVNFTPDEIVAKIKDVLNKKYL